MSTVIKKLTSQKTVKTIAIIIALGIFAYVFFKVKLFNGKTLTPYEAITVQFGS